LGRSEVGAVATGWGPSPVLSVNVDSKELNYSGSPLESIFSDIAVSVDSAGFRLLSKAESSEFSSLGLWAKSVRFANGPGLRRGWRAQPEACATKEKRQSGDWRSQRGTALPGKYITLRATTCLLENVFLLAGRVSSMGRSKKCPAGTPPGGFG